MANVNLKTDFKDGEFLYADQLKNNFEAIQAALGAMNAIVWQDNADKVVTFRGTTEELMNRPIIDGQILYDTTTGESYIDYLGKRISTGSGNAIHIGDTEPTNASTQLWIDRDELSAVGSEVVNSLEGNEERMAPSVAAVNKINIYSTEETFTGKYWINGKKVYKKVVDFGGLPSSGVKTVAHNIQNLDLIINYDVLATNGNVSWKMPLLNISSLARGAAYSINKTIITIDCGSEANRSDLTTCYAIIEYTKTTD